MTSFKEDPIPDSWNLAWEGHGVLRFRKWRSLLHVTLHLQLWRSIYVTLHSRRSFWRDGWTRCDAGDQTFRQNRKGSPQSHSVCCMQGTTMDSVVKYINSFTSTDNFICTWYLPDAWPFIAIIRRNKLLPGNTKDCRGVMVRRRRPLGTCWTTFQQK